jgi:hypothetical protein
MCVVLALAVTNARAQEAVRSSMAGQDAAEDRKRAAREKFNVQLGPVSLRFQSTFEVEANDNVRLAADHPQADLIFRPQVGP